MSQITFSLSKDKIVLHKDGANFALTFSQIESLEKILPIAKQELKNANEQKRT